MSEEISLRKEVLEFAQEMERVMSEHDYKKGDSWKRCSLDYLWERLSEEISEAVYEAENERGNPEEFIDVANFCMMIYHRLKENEEGKVKWYT